MSEGVVEATPRGCLGLSLRLKPEARPVSLDVPGSAPCEASVSLESKLHPCFADVSLFCQINFTLFEQSSKKRRINLTKREMNR